MRIESEILLDFKDVLIRPKRSKLVSRKTVNLTRDYVFKHSKRSWSGIPIMPANMDTTGTFEMAEALFKFNMPTALDKHYSAEKLIEFYNKHTIEELSLVFYCIGVLKEDYDKLHLVLKSIDSNKLQNICIDVANGYSESFLEYVQKIRLDFPDKTIMAGNVVTGEMVEALILAGADIIKVGIGPGSVCTTRKVTGVGYPQLSAIIGCADAAHGMNAHVCADGGCTMPGDVVKAFGAGADFVMSGNLFSGHTESGGALIEKNGKKYKIYYGMSSETAMNTHSGGVAPYRASEGKTVEVRFKGEVSGTIQLLLGGLRSACTYVGASRLKDLTKCTTFVRVTQHHNVIHGDEL
ncbi:MAG: GMP reductase [Candidatus Woesearchaeota archaeon]